MTDSLSPQNPAHSTGQQAAFDELAAGLLPVGTKGIPPQAMPLTLGQIGQQGWSLADLTKPVAVLSRSALAHNSAAMRRFLVQAGVQIAPHGKTTMAPQLFRDQMADGAWGITISTVQHFAVCRHFGFDRLIIANQWVSRHEIDFLLSELARAPQLTVYMLADSVAGIECLGDGLARHPGARPPRLLIERGVEGGRAGCRTTEAALDVARAAVAAGLPVSGVEGFEGILSEVGAVDAFLHSMIETARALAAEGLFDTSSAIILSAGGSVYYDRVAAELRQSLSPEIEVTVVSRSGCYVTHDSGTIARAFANIAKRDAFLAANPPRPALTVYASVQSRPEPGLAIVTMGRRDAGTDSALPVPQTIVRAAAPASPQPVPEGWSLTALNDQHGYLRLPDDAELAIGDVVGFGISHPCTTFDKWPVVFVADDDLRIVDAVKTFF